MPKHRQIRYQMLCIILTVFRGPRYWRRIAFFLGGVSRALRPEL